MNAIEDCLGMRIDPELQTAITHTTVELEYVRQLLEHRGGNDQRLIEEEFKVMARLADLKIQAAYVPGK